MENAESILDKVFENKQAQDLSQFDPEEVLKTLFSELNEREQEVLARRFGLSGQEPQTLEIIGKHFGVTRERVRQIETGSIKKLRKLELLADQLKQVEVVVHLLLDQHGGILQENHLLELALANRQNTEITRAILLFFIEKLLVNHFDLVYHPDHFHRSWKLVHVDEAMVRDIVKRIVEIVESHAEPIHEEDLIRKVIDQLDADLHEDKVRGHLRVSRQLKQNIFGQWGIHNWNTITPKRMNDKIHLVLKHLKKPMHFTEIADEINKLNFDHKRAYPATVHNELILDEKYVLVGRGIYALSEWGYQPGVVADVIERVLLDATQPLDRDEIVKRVLEQRIVGKSTVHLALMNKNRFKRMDDGKYVPTSKA